MQSEAQGVFKYVILTPEIVLDMSVAALAGDRTAMAYRQAIESFLDCICTVRPTRQCLLCDGEFSSAALPGAFVALSAHREEAPQHIVMSALCDGCAVGADLNGRIMRKYRESMCPDLRVLYSVHPVHPVLQ